MPNRDFLATNKIADGIMRKDSTTAKLTQLNTLEERLLRNLTGRADLEIERNKKMFTPLNLLWVSFNWGPRCDILSNNTSASAI